MREFFDAGTTLQCGVIQEMSFLTGFYCLEKSQIFISKMDLLFSVMHQRSNFVGHFVATACYLLVWCSNWLFIICLIHLAVILIAIIEFKSVPQMVVTSIPVLYRMFFIMLQTYMQMMQMI